MIKIIYLLFTILYFTFNFLWAGTLFLDLNTLKKPAADLLYEGKAITSHEAAGLIKKGVDISRLNPRGGILWKNRKDNVSVVSHDFLEVKFDSYLSSTKGLFRSSIDLSRKGLIEPFTMTVGLNSHGALMRAGLLRKLGYQIEVPEYVRKIKINFESVKKKDLFLDHMSDRSLTARTRWIVENGKNEKFVVLQDILLEKGRIHVHPIHWGIISSYALKDRRVFRSLIIPFVLTDFIENANFYGWSIGKFFNDSVIFSYLMAESFSQTTYDDAKWIARKILELDRNDFEEIVSGMHLPFDISKLLIEKIVSRRNSLVHLFFPEMSKLSIEKDISEGSVVKGKLTRDSYDGYALHFSGETPENPLRFSELARYFLVEEIGVAFTEIFAEINKYTQLVTIDNAYANHREELYNDFLTHVKTYGSSKPYDIPMGVWGGPVAGINMTANRSIVSGTYYGSDAPIQLVDNLAVSANVGYFLGYDGLTNVMPSALAGISVSRNYMHLKPVKSIKEGLKTSWKDLLVTKFLGDISNIIKDDYKCSISSDPWVEKVIVDGKEYQKINYDNSSDDAKIKAEELKKKLISQGVSLFDIIMNPFDLVTKCDDELDDALSDDIQKFTTKLSPGEMIVIVDGISADAGANVQIPLSALLGSMGTGVVSLGGGVNYSMMNRIMITKSESGVQVYRQKTESKSHRFNFDLDYYINIFQLSKNWSQNRAESQYFSIPLEDITTTEKKDALLALKGVIRNGSTEYMAEKFKPYFLDHKVNNKVSRFKFLFKKWDWLRQEHSVGITPPESEKYINSDHKRKLFLVQNVKRTGKATWDFLVDIFKYFSGGVGPTTNRQGENPGSTFLGKSNMITVSTELETTKKSEFSPVVIYEDVSNGWSISRKKILKKIMKVEKKFGFVTQGRRIDRSIFNDTRSLLLYELRSTLILYPSVVLKLHDVFSQGRTKTFEYLVSLYGEKKLKRYCEWERDINDAEFFNEADLAFLSRSHPYQKYCLPSWMRTVLRSLRKLPRSSERKAYARYFNNIIQKMLKVISPAEFVSNLEPDDYFIVSKIIGFRTGDGTGELNYLSDSIGLYDRERGAGIFKAIGSDTGISTYELYARYFSEGF